MTWKQFKKWFNKDSNGIIISLIIALVIFGIVIIQFSTMNMNMDNYIKVMNLNDTTYNYGEFTIGECQFNCYIQARDKCQKKCTRFNTEGGENATLPNQTTQS